MRVLRAFFLNVVILNSRPVRADWDHFKKACSGRNPKLYPCFPGCPPGGINCGAIFERAEEGVRLSFPRSDAHLDSSLSVPKLTVPGAG